MLFQPFPVTGQSVVLLPGPGDWCGTAPPSQSRSAFIQSLWEALQPPQAAHGADTCALPPATVTGQKVLCEGMAANYSVGTAADWVLSDATGTVVASGSTTAPPYNFTPTFTVPGNYRLSATGASFCPPEDFFIKVVATPEAPDVITGPDAACPGIPTRYEAGNPIPGTTYAWSLSTAGDVNATMGDHSYLTFTTFPATIQAVRVTTGEVQCPSAPLTKVVTDAVPDVVTITVEEEPCHSTTHAYEVSYTEGDSYEWSIANPLLGSIVSGDHTGATVLWNAPSPALPPATATQLKLKIRKCGVTHDFTYTVTIKGMPTITSVSLTDATICSGDDAIVTLVTDIPVAGAESYTWQWGDGAPVTTLDFPGPAGTSFTFSHPYNTSAMGGTVAFTPAITIVNPNGCIGTVTATAPTITVLPSPAAFISPATNLAHCGTGWSDVLTATETTGIGSSAAFSWSGPITATTPSITATAYGAYTVTVTNTVSGCSDATTVNIFEHCPEPGEEGPCGPEPEVSFTLDPDCNEIEITAVPGGGSAITSTTWTPTGGLSVVGSPTSTTLKVSAPVAGHYLVRYRVYYEPDCHKDYLVNVMVPYVPDLRKEITCNMAGSNYKITLYDHTTVYLPSSSPGITRKYFTESWSLIATDVLETSIFQAPNTTKTYYEVIQGGSSAPCTTSVTVTTPVFPTTSLSVTAPYMPGCVEDVVFTFTHISTGSGLGYWWDFDDVSYNASAEPEVGKVYSSFGAKSPTLKVTDEYGCYATASETVTVMPNNYKPAEITSGPNPVCQGTPVTLTYVPEPGAIIADEIIWYEQTTPVATTTGAVYNVTTPGGYWAEGHGAYGCKVTTNMVPVQIHQVPQVAISGNAGQCVDQPFTLTTQNLGSGYSYTWSGPGATAVSSPSLTLTHSTPGAYTYTITITDLATGCTRQSPAFTVTVSAPPTAPVLSFDVLSCQPYELRLTATGATGTYNWSNGMSGTVITTPHGGPYQVTLTDLNGCRVECSINTPRSLEEYLWVFPTGCFCMQASGAYLIGPLILLDYWAWHKNGSPDVSGIGVMPDYAITPGNVYSMELKNSWCYVQSGEMHYLSDTCSDPESRRPAVAGEDRTPGSMGLADALSLAPNPAGRQAVATYSFAPGSKLRTMELYDVTGRKLQSHVLTGDSGSIVLQLSDYSAGLYQVVLKRDGVVVQQTKLSVTR